VDAFVRERKSLFLFFQGHPEYQADTLLLEYRRDVGRYVKGESETYPAMPEGYFNAETAALLADVRKRIASERTDDSLAHFPITLLSTKVANTWRPVSTRIYRNWLEYQWTQKERALAAPPVSVRNVAESSESRLNLR
jgi:homoserine O-succinyltransferase/O-acetyltransferase